MKNTELKIVIADDHSVVREGIIRALSSEFPEAGFGEASDANELMELIHESEWDIVILDINMPVTSGLEVLKDIKANYKDIPVIIFSMYPEDQFAVKALKLGASAYLKKNISLKILSEAIRKILEGGTYITPVIADLMAGELWSGRNKLPHEMLSAREHQVLIFIASGNSVSDIARKLQLSVKTISVYRSIILRKMNLKNNSEIMNYAFKNNLVEINEL